MKVKRLILIGSLLSVTTAYSAPLSPTVSLDVGYGTAHFEFGNTNQSLFPSISVGANKQLTNKLYFHGALGFEGAAMRPGTDIVGGNMYRGKLSTRVSYRLPITVVPRTRFFVGALLEASYGAYNTLHDTRWGYTWTKYDDVGRGEFSAGLTTQMEYRPSIDFGATVNIACDISLNSTFQACRAGLGFRF